MIFHRFCALIFVLGVLLGACGSESPEEAAAREQLEQAERDINQALATDEGRRELALTIASGSPLTNEQALCFVDNSDTDSLVGVLRLASGEAGTDIDNVLEPIREAFNSCGVALDNFDLAQ